MNIRERVLSLYACKYVDYVDIYTPYEFNQSVIDKFHHINYVCHGTNEHLEFLNNLKNNPYKLAIESGIIKVVDSPLPYITTESMVKRIIDNRLLYEERNRKKEAKQIVESNLKNNQNIQVYE